MELKNNLFIIGAAMKFERKQRQIPQDELAKIIDVNQSTVSRIENGDSSISIEYYEKALSHFNIYLNVDEYHFEEKLFHLYEHFDSMSKEEIDSISQEVNAYEKLNVSDFFIKKLIQVCLDLHQNNISDFYIHMEYLLNIEDIFQNKSDYIHQVMKGYYHHFKRNFIQADQIFKEACIFSHQLTFTDHVFDFIYANNNLILRRYRLSQHYILNLLRQYNQSKNAYKELTTTRLLGLIYYFDSNYEDTVQEFKKCLNQEILEKVPDLKKQSNFFIGTSYVALNQYQNAIPYFMDNIEHHLGRKTLSYDYAYLLYCLKKTNLDDQFNYYKNQLVEREIVKKKVNQVFINLLMIESESIDIEFFIKHFNLLYQNIFQHDDRYHHTKLIFSLVKEELWKKRRYAIYKQLNEVILRIRTGGCDCEL